MSERRWMFLHTLWHAILRALTNRMMSKGEKPIHSSVETSSRMTTFPEVGAFDGRRLDTTSKVADRRSSDTSKREHCEPMSTNLTTPDEICKGRFTPYSVMSTCHNNIAPYSHASTKQLSISQYLGSPRGRLPSGSSFPPPLGRLYLVSGAL
jgi:hypothetical protein